MYNPIIIKLIILLDTITMKIILFFALIILLFIPDISDAGIYKWKDDSGKTHYTDSPNKIPAKYRNKDKVEEKTGVQTKTKENFVGSNKKVSSNPEVAKDKTAFTLTTWKGKKVKIKKFKVGYWKDDPKKIRRGGSIPAKLDYEFGAIFTITKIDSDDSLSITLFASAPMKGYEGETQKFGSSLTVTGDYNNETRDVSIKFDKRMLSVYEIPGDWHLSFQNENKVFRAQKIRVTKPQEKKSPK
ncbi:MAG: DUF4124 domain-containing protein [Nitrospinales bacterium]